MEDERIEDSQEEQCPFSRQARSALDSELD